MAEWKKVVVSGSQAELSTVTVDTNIINSGTVAGSKVTGSFTGSFNGDGSSLTGITATSLGNSLTDGNGIANFTFDGSGAASVAVEADGTTLTVGASGVKVSDAGINVTQLNTNVAGTGIAGGGGSALSVDLNQLDVAAIDVANDSFAIIDANDSNGSRKESIADFIAAIDGNGLAASSGVLAVDLDGSTLSVGASGVKVADAGVGTTQIADSLGELGSNSFTGSFSGSFSGSVSIDLEDLVAGNGLSGTNYDGQTTRTFAVSSSDSGATLNITSNGVKVANGGIDTTQLADDAVTIGKIADAATGSIFATVSGDATIGEGGVLALANGVVDTNQLANDAVTADKIADAATGSILSTLSGDVTSTAAGVATLANNSVGTVQIEDDAVTLAKIAEAATGSILNTISGDITVTTAGVATIGADKVDGSKLANDITIANDLTVTRNATVNGDLTVAGTASFQHSTNLAISDKYILLSSGSSGAGDGGFVVEQGTDGFGELFGFDSAQTRFGVTSSFNADTSADFTPDAFVSVAIDSGMISSASPNDVNARYKKNGNIFVQEGSDNIYIYVEDA